MILWVEYLGPCGAAEVSRRRTAEWPPHPDRLFQALVDAAAPAGAADRAALAWLETQTPPALVCPDAIPLDWGRDGKAYVPVNYPDAGLPEWRARQERVFPQCWPQGPIGFVWDDPPGGHLARLDGLARRLSHLGRADSLVLAWAAPGRAAADLCPDPRGPLALRVPHAGRLDVLDAAFAAGRRSPLAPHARYGKVGAGETASPWQELVAVRLARPLSLSRAADAADALRRAVLARLGDAAPALAHGHGVAARQPHLAWLGLPNLGLFARGELLGLALAVPVGADPIERAACVRALLAADHLMLDGRRVDLGRPTRALSLAAATWSRPGRVWASVTPVVLDRYPKRGRAAEDELARSVELAGYPTPARVEWRQESALPFPPARVFRLRRPGRLYGHAIIEFVQAQRGPLLIGAERHFGLGLFLPHDARM